MLKNTNQLSVILLGMALLWGCCGVANAVTPMVAAGSSHSMALSADGSVWAWGDNSAGQLGDGTTIERSSPVLLGLTDIVSVAAGVATSFAVKSDGSLWAWGANQYGQLGDGTMTSRSSPVRVQGLSGVVSVMAASCNSFHTLAVKSDGSVWAWGENIFGELGDGTTINRLSPVQVQGLTGVVSVAVGDFSSFALKSDGSVWAWGDNIFGELGDGTSISASSFPMRIPGLSGVVSVVAGGSGVYAVKQDGSLWAWGHLNGIMSSNLSPVPVRIPELSGVVSVATQGSSTFAVKSDGSVWAMGSNNYGERGYIIYSYPPLLEQVQGVSGVVALADGGFLSSGIIALKSDGSLWAWGDNSFGQLGDGSLATRLSPVLVNNATSDGFLNLKTGTTVNVPAAQKIPFFVSSSGGIDDQKTTATVKTTTKFNSTDVGKSGAVYVTAMVPSGSLGVASKVTQRAKFAAQAANSSVMMQLTPSGWQQVINGQLIPYATGVLGDQLAAQSILNNADTTNLKGAQFCLGYGASATDMTGTGRMRVVATIPDPNAKSAPASCLPVSDSQVFSYAAGNYPNLFSGAVTGGIYQQYDYRYYSSSQNYLGVDNAGMVYILGSVSGGAIQSVGAVSSFADAIYAWQAAQPH